MLIFLISVIVFHLKHQHEASFHKIYHETNQTKAESTTKSKYYAEKPTIAQDENTLSC